MNRRSFLHYANLAGLAATIPASSLAAEQKAAAAKNRPATASNTRAETLLLKDYRPRSIFKVPVTQIEQAKYPLIDMHSHPEPKTEAEINVWLKNMDAVNVEKSVILTMTTGKEFDEINAQYSRHPDRFEVWCGLDFSGYDQRSFPESAVKELVRCQEAGARGSGEIHDKGMGLRSGKSVTRGTHPDDRRM